MNHLSKTGGHCFAFLLALLCLVGCTSTPSDTPQSIELLVVIDNTETVSTVKATSDDIIQFLTSKAGIDFSEVYSGSIKLVVMPINGQINNIHNTVRLRKGQSHLNSIPKKRKEAQQRFLEDAQQAILDVMQDSSIYVGRSYVSRPLVRQLSRMSNAQAEYKTVLLISDMMDNNPDFSFYRMDANEITESLANTFGNIDIYGLDISCYYSPGDVEVDRHFDRVKPIWQKIFTDAGADFTYVTSLK